LVDQFDALAAELVSNLISAIEIPGCFGAPALLDQGFNLSL
jgi:hypothetical protein